MKKNNYCIDCGIEIYKTSKRCYSCNKKGKLNHNFIDGRCLKISKCVDCGKKLNKLSFYYGTKRCTSCAHKLDWIIGKYEKRDFSGENNPNHKSGKYCKNKKCIDCGTKISRGSLRCSFHDDKNRSLIMKGKKTGRLLRPTWDSYKNIWMRSSWEVAYAKYLDKQDIKWQYESKTFDLGNTTYIPDFYLPETDTYIEIKGYESEIFIKKYKNFKRKFKNIKIKILKYLDLIKIKIIKRR